MTMHDGLTEFERDLLESVRQTKGGEFAAIHTPEQITARRRGRPLGSVAMSRKVSTTIRLDEDIMSAFRAAGHGWQTRINTVLRKAVQAGWV